MNSVYIIDEKIEGADPKTFEVLISTFIFSFAKEKNNCYKYVETINPNSERFEYYYEGSIVDMSECKKFEK